MDLSNITVNKQSSIRMEYDGGVLYFDPLEIAVESHDADVIFITHNHYDHFSVSDICKVMKNDTILICPKTMEKDVLDATALSELSVKTVEPNENVKLPNGLGFETILAYNNNKKFHPKSANWCGYVVTIEGARYYVAGDTDDTVDNRKVSCDVALVPIGGTFTMTYSEAAEFINAIAPKIVIPTHYGEMVGSIEDGQSFKELVDKGIDVILKL